MQTAMRQSAALSKGRPVGRKRQPQKPEIRRTLAGRFGARLAELAAKQGITASKIAGIVGKTDDTVRLYFAGEVVPPLNDWPKLAKALGVEVKDLLP